MSEPSVATVNLDPKLMETIIRSHVHGAVLAAFGGGEEATKRLVQSVVSAAFSLKRKDAPGQSRHLYGKEAEQNYFEWLVMEQIHLAAKKECESFVEDLKPEIAKETRRLLGQRKDDLVKKIASQLATQVTGNFRAHVSFREDD